MKKALLSLIVTFLAYIPLLHASIDMIKPNDWDRFYGGIGVGIDYTATDYQFDDMLYYANAGTLTHDTENENLGEFNGAIDAVFGYGKIFLPSAPNLIYYLGWELQLNYIPTHITTDGSSTDFIEHSDSRRLIQQDTFTTRLSNNYSISGGIRAGTLITQYVMLYSSFGLELARFQNTITATGTALNSDGTYNTPPENVYGFHMNKIGWKPGIGIEVNLNQSFALRVQTTFTYFGKIQNHKTTEITFPNEASEIQQVTLDQSYNYQRISRAVSSLQFIYRFN